MPMMFPSTREITHVVRNRAVDPTRFIGRSFCPIREVYSAEIEFDVIEASSGMTPAHNLGADPKLVKLAGMRTKKVGTGYWKETKRIDEKELLYARAAGSYNERAGRMLVIEKSMQLDDRLETRIEWLTWQPLVNGKVQIDENGVKYTVPYDIPSKNLPTPDKKWSDPAADILGDINKYILMFRGTGAKATKAYFDYKVAGYMAANNGIKDLLKNTTYAAFLSATNISQAMKLFYPDIDFVIYDEGYVDDKANFNSFIPDTKFLLVGQGQPGEDMMDFGTTISLHNGGLDKPQPGKFSIVDDKSEQAKNPFVDITVGIYGLPRLYHPNWVVSANVG
jgi:hypothetical protein